MCTVTGSTCSRSTQSRPLSFFHLYCLCCKCECVLLLQAPVPAIHIHEHRTLSLHKAYKISTLCVMLQQAPVPVSGTQIYRAFSPVQICKLDSFQKTHEMLIRWQIHTEMSIKSQLQETVCNIYLLQVVSFISLVTGNQLLLLSHWWHFA